MTSDITCSSPFERCSRARHCASKKSVRSITRSDIALIHVFDTVRPSSRRDSLLKLCPRPLFLLPPRPRSSQFVPVRPCSPPFAPFLPVPRRSSPFVSQVDNRRAPITGERDINVLLYRALEIPSSFRRVSRYFPPFPSLFACYRSPRPPVPFFRSRPKLNTLESERLNLSAITRSFPSSSIKAGQDGSRRLGRTFERRLILGIDGTNISAESVTARVCVSADGNSRREPSPGGRGEETGRSRRRKKRRGTGKTR